jgi:hypothetical protein
MTGKLTDFLPSQVTAELQMELDAMGRFSPDGLQDRAALRHLYESVLSRHRLKCPHPYRVDLGEGSFRCQLCESIFLPFTHPAASRFRKP